MNITGASVLKQEIARETTQSTATIAVSRLPFSDIPKQSRLFIEYQDNPAGLTRYYPNAVTSPESLPAQATEILANYKTDRKLLCDALVEINTGIGAGDATFKNIDRLRDTDALAVVTGQQAGLFTGPLYTIFKALSAVKLAETLASDGVKAVPVFWAATEDHDFDEVAEVFVIGKSGELVRSNYRPLQDVNNSPVGKVKIDAEMDSVIERFFSDLPETEFSADLRQLLASAWSDGTLYGDAFASTMASILGRFGIIFFDPLHEGIKRLSVPIYCEAIDNAEQIVSGVINRSRDLERDGYHAQVLVEDDYFPLFWHDDFGQRLALRTTASRTYRVRATNTEFTTAELKEMALNSPAKFSPGVMLRPVVQDYILPTLAYFGGAAEVAYFAQNSVVYRTLGRPVTPILHRQSFTIVEARQRRILDKFGLRLKSLFEGRDAIALRVAEFGLVPETARMFSDVEEKINTELNRIDQAVSTFDPTIAESLAKRRRKIIYHIAALRRTTLLAESRKNDTLNRQIENLFSTLVPNGQLQERSLNVFSFLNKFGPNLVDWIYDAIDLEDNGHRIIEL